MINYNRLGYGIKRDFATFIEKLSRGLTKPKNKFVMQMVYGLLAGNRVHLSEIARFLNESISLKKTIDRLSRNLFTFEQKEIIMDNYIAQVRKQIDEDNAVIVIDNSDITKPCSPMMEAISDVRDGSTGEIKKGYSKKGIILLRQQSYRKGKRCLCLFMKKFFLLLKMVLSAKHTRIYVV